MGQEGAGSGGQSDDPRDAEGGPDAPSRESGEHNRRGIVAVVSEVGERLSKRVSQPAGPRDVEPPDEAKSA